MCPGVPARLDLLRHHAQVPRGELRPQADEVFEPSLTRVLPGELLSTQHPRRLLLEPVLLDLHEEVPLAEDVADFVSGQRRFDCGGQFELPAGSGAIDIWFEPEGGERLIFTENDPIGDVKVERL